MRTAPLLFVVACAGVDGPSPAPDDTASPGAVDSAGAPLPAEVRAVVTLDGDPIQGAWVGVGGGTSTTTDASGQARLALAGGEVVIASHPEARTGFTMARGPEVTVALQRFSRDDNEDYVFDDPGEPGDLGTTAQCAHCHQSALTDWDASPHRTAASNPVVQDVYAGVASVSTEAACREIGGTWADGVEPGTGDPVARCYTGAGTLPDLNDCADPACTEATAFGGCADCHAPGIDGRLGGRDLRDALGRAHDKGVHCDVCHKVEAVDPAAEPGVAGRLRILRPSEIDPVDGLEPLFFGPYPDVPNPRMGAVPRALFREAELCGACHQLDQPALVGELDPVRWPEGRLPVHSTFAEWSEGPYAPTSPCQSCHMPPETRYLTAVDWVPGITDEGVANGWRRPPGSIRRHTFDGPRGRDPALLRLALALDVEVAARDGDLVVDVTTTNVGAGHAVPTGEPLRTVILTVEAACDGAPVPATGGDVVPDFGGALDVQGAGGDWTRWPGATVGERIRVVQRAGWRDYAGPGPFGDGRFDAAAKGLPVESRVDEATIVAVDGDAVTLDHALAAGDVAYRVDDEAWAGAPGFAFARVLADADGVRQVPHHRAIDVVIDNRIPPRQAVRTTHRFSDDCAEPEVTVRLHHRDLPLGLARSRGWELHDTVMAEVIR